MPCGMRFGIGGVWLQRFTADQPGLYGRTYDPIGSAGGRGRSSDPCPSVDGAA